QLFHTMKPVCILLFGFALSVTGWAVEAKAETLKAEILKAGSSEQPFILGADITFLLEDEAAGAVYYDHGVQKDFFQILKDNDFNYVRVPSVVETTRTFSRGDLEHVKIVAQRAKAAHLGLLVD